MASKFALQMSQKESNVFSEQNIILAFTCTWSPDVLSAEGGTLYGIHVGFIESDKVLTIFYVFICI